MSKKTIGLCMIFKDEIADAVRIVKNYSEYFDFIYFTVTHKSQLEKFEMLPKVAGDNVRMLVSYFEWENDFSKARNFNFSQAETDYIFWMDADDDIINPQALPKLIEQYPDADSFYFDYLYAFDESGNPSMVHPRERLIKNNKLQTWKGRVHETLIPVDDVILKKGKSQEVQVKHNSTFEHSVESHKRNVQILVNEWNEHKENTDPRTIAYLANELASLNRHDEAIKFYEKHIQLSGWTEDKYMSWNKIANSLVLLYLRTKEEKLLETAINSLSEAIILMPNVPDAYLNMGEVYWHLKQWEKAIEWTNTGLTKAPVTTLPYHDPTRYTIRPLPILAYSWLHLDDIDKAYAYMAEAFKRGPKNPFIKDNFPFFETVYNETKVFKNFINLANYLEANDKEKLKLLPNIIPDTLAGDDRFIRLRNRYIPAKVWNDKSVVIFCPSSPEEWAPPSVIKGIGGSEEAVIYLSQSLHKLGYEVTVFNSCGDLEGNYDGVEYKNYWHFNKNDMFNVCIAWRSNIFQHGVSANRKLVWLHDVPFKNDWESTDYDLIDKIIVLSNYHKSLLPDCPEDKIYVSTNGINVEDFIAVDKKNIHRNPHRIIYGSSYNRGLEHLLDMWPDIRKSDPLAELHIFYGWNTFDAMNADNQDLMKWKASLIKKMDQPGIKDHGRVGHKKLLEEYAKSNIWAYPTFFKEINCITALKAQASGCYPVFHSLYALNDTCKYGSGIQEAEHTVMLMNFKKELIAALGRTKDETYVSNMKQTIRDQYSWDKVAEDWSRHLFV